MATFHLDYENGNDANDGSTWALAWKTITNGATAARIAPGDTVCIAQSPPPTSLGQLGTWTNLSRTVTLTNAVTKNVYLDGAWTASANVTCTTSATCKEGSNSSSVAIAAGFTTGKAAYYALGSVQDFSAYQQLSFWIQSSVALATADTLRVCLCSDTTGDAIVDSFSVPGIPYAAGWHCYTVDKGAALGASIQSVALYGQADPGTTTVLLDNIIACKAKSAPDSLTLSSLIGKNNGEWFPICSINGATVSIDNAPSSGFGSGRGYYGTTESVTTYKREAIRFTALDGSTNYRHFDVQDSGTVGNPISFVGGYNTATSLVDGISVFDGVNARGSLFSNTSIASYINVSGFAAHRCFAAIGNTSFTNSSLSIEFAVGCQTGGYVQSAGTTMYIGYANNNDNAGVYFGNGEGGSVSFLSCNSNASAGVNNTAQKRGQLTGVNVCNNGTQGVLASGCSLHGTVTNLLSNSTSLYVASAGNIFNIANISATSIAIRTASQSEFVLNGANITSGTILGSSDFPRLRILFNNCTLWTSPQASTTYPQPESAVWSMNEGGNTDTHKCYMAYGLVASDVTTRHTASGISWKLSPTSASATALLPIPMKVAAVACAANAAVTVSVWFRRTNTGLTARLVCRGGQLTGITKTASSMTAAGNRTPTSITRSGTTATLTYTAHGLSNGATVGVSGANQSEYNGVFVIANVTANTFDYTMTADPGATATGTLVFGVWEQLSVTVTPTQKGVLEFHAECYGGTTHSCYVDDVEIT